MPNIESDADIKAEISYKGVCSCCGLLGHFECDHYSFREGYSCAHCKASMRYRAQAESIVRCFQREGATNLQALVKEAGFQRRRIFEPGVAGPFRRYFKSLPHYQQSFYWGDVAPGEQRDGVRCENLEQLSFDNNDYDLVISSDIFEHIRKPMQAFAEIYRVLKTGGAHLFSIPVEYPMPSSNTPRVDVSTAEDVHLLPAHYHGDGKGGRSLVYNDFGSDLIVELNAMGFLCETERPAPVAPDAYRTLSFVCWKL